MRKLWFPRGGSSRQVRRVFASMTAIAMVWGLQSADAAQRKMFEGKASDYRENYYVGDSSAAVSARLVDAKKNAKLGAAIVEVDVSGAQLIDSSFVTNTSDPTQAHLHYRVDNGPIVATPATRMSFHGLSAGRHQITVQLADGKHMPLGPESTLFVTVP